MCQNATSFEWEEAPGATIQLDTSQIPEIQTLSSGLKALSGQTASLSGEVDGLGVLVEEAKADAAAA